MGKTTMRPYAQGGYSADGSPSNWAAIDAMMTELYADQVFAVTVAVEAGNLREGWCKPGYVGAVVGVDAIVNDKPASAADGCTAFIESNDGTIPIVESFDLTASPATTGALAAQTVVDGEVAITATTLIRCAVLAGADVTGGKDVTFLIKVRRGAAEE